MSFYTCFDWFKKLRVFSYVRNLKLDVVLKAWHAVVIGWFSFKGAPLGLFKFISNYLPYFEKINILFNIIAKKKFELIYKDWSKLFVRFIRNNLNQVVHTVAYPATNKHWPNKNCDQSLIVKNNDPISWTLSV
jgi:hypothetical protein